MLGLKKVESLRLNILCDNSVKVGIRGLLGEHGFSALITAGRESVLLDAGQSGAVIANNIGAMKIVPPSAVVLSHGHYDHSGGLLDYAGLCKKPCSLFTHENAFGKRLKKVRGELQDIGIPFTRESLVDAGYRIRESGTPSMVSDWLATSGVIDRESFEEPETEFFIVERGVAKKDPFLDDAAVGAVVRGKGIVMVTGCAHAGVINTALHFQRLLGEERIHAIVGGFHLIDASEKKLGETISALERLDPSYIIPGHCTGRVAADAMRDAFGKRVIFSEVGLERVF